MPKRNDEKTVAREQRLAAVARLHSQGRNQYEMAAQLEVSQATISRDIATLIERWKASALSDIDRKIGEEVELTRQLQRQFQDAWTLSQREKESRKTRTARARGEGEGQQLSAEVRVEKRDGNPAFLLGALQCQITRCRIMGIIPRAKRDRSMDDVPRIKFLRFKVVNGNADGQPADANGAGAT